MFIIEQSVDVKDAEKIKTALLSALDEHKKGGFPLDLSGPEPSQVALQIGIAGMKELEARGLDPMPGIFLEAILLNNIAASTGV
jgi:hypothetical protein